MLDREALRVQGLPRKLPRRQTAYRLSVTDQFGQPAPGATVSVSGRGLALQTMTDSRGHAGMSLIRLRGGLRLSISAPTYRTLTVVIK